MNIQQLTKTHLHFTNTKLSSYHFNRRSLPSSNSNPKYRSSTEGLSTASHLLKPMPCRWWHSRPSQASHLWSISHSQVNLWFRRWYIKVSLASLSSLNSPLSRSHLATLRLNRTTMQLLTSSSIDRRYQSRCKQALTYVYLINWLFL